MPPSQPHWKRLTGMGVKKRLSLASRRDNSVVHFMPQSSPCDQAAPAEVTSLNFSSLILLPNNKSCTRKSLSQALHPGNLTSHSN